MIRVKYSSLSKTIFFATFVWIGLVSCDKPFSDRPILDKADFGESSVANAIATINKEKNPTTNQIQIKLRLLDALRESEEVILWFEKFQNSNVWQIQDVIIYATALIESNQYDKFEDLLFSVSQLKEQPEIKILLAQKYYEDGQYERSLTFIREVQEMNFKSNGLNSLLINVLSELNDFEPIFLALSSEEISIGREDSLRLFYNFYQYQNQPMQIDSLLWYALAESLDQDLWVTNSQTYFSDKKEYKSLMRLNDFRLDQNLQSSIDWTYQKAQIFDQMNFGDSVIFYIEKVINTDSEYKKEAILLKAKWLDRRGLFYAALALYDSLAETYPEDEFASEQSAILRRKIAYLREREEQRQIFQSLPTISPLKIDDN